MMCHSHLLSVFLGFATSFFELASSKDEGACRILVLEKILCLKSLRRPEFFFGGDGAGRLVDYQSLETQQVCGI